MDINDLPKPSPLAVGISTLVLAVLGVIGGIWFYQDQAATRTERLKRQANRQMKRVRGHFEDDHLSTGAKTGLALGALGVLAGLILGGSEVYRRTHDR